MPFGIGISIALAFLYLFFWPLSIEPKAWIPPQMPILSGKFKPNNRLSNVQRLLDGVGIGPEAVAYNKQGSLFTGLEDGRIIRFKPDGKDYAVFCNTGGRPAGLKFDLSGNLIVADAKKGLLSIAPNGSAELLADEAEGVPINLANDLDIGADGTIYFSDSSIKHSSVILDLFEHRPNGRLLSCTPSSRTVKVLLEGLYFPNGVTLSPDQTFLLVNEMWKYRVRRYWLKGNKKGQTDVFIDNLPGLPDNITSNGKGIFWLALLHGPEGRKSIDKLLPRPFLRKLLLRLPDFIKPEPKRTGYVLGLNLNGKVVCNLQDSNGEKYAEISSVIEREGILYLGSISESAIGCIAAPLLKTGSSTDTVSSKGADCFK